MTKKLADDEQTCPFGSSEASKGMSEVMEANVIQIGFRSQSLPDSLKRNEVTIPSVTREDIWAVFLAV